MQWTQEQQADALAECASIEAEIEALGEEEQRWRDSLPDSSFHRESKENTVGPDFEVRRQILRDALLAAQPEARKEQFFRAQERFRHCP